MGNLTNEPLLITEKTKECPTCGKMLNATDGSCPSCGARFEVHTRAYCTHCHKLITTEADGKCPECGGTDLLDQRLNSKLTAAGKKMPETATAGAVLSLASKESPPSETKQCPRCAEKIKAEARLCRYCGARFEIAVKGYCTNCHAEVGVVENDKCSRCGSDVIDRHVASALVGEQVLPVSAPRSTPLPEFTSAPTAAIATSPGNNVRMPIWQFYLSPNGRIGRLTFFLKGILPVWGILVLCGVVFSSITPSMNTSQLSDLNGIFLSIILVVMLFILWVMLMLIVKRFHDLGRSGWNIFLWLIPLVGQIIYFWNWLELYFKKGIGPNRFGDSAD